jgi:DNA-binding response OmpR family regulator
LSESPKKILVVEDDEVVVVLISHILARHSYVVHTTLDALEAERMLRADAYDAVLMDLKMPNGGVELIHRIGAQDPALLEKIIVVTGAIHEARKLDGIPVHAVVRKPFEVHELVETVRACVSRKA